MEEQEKIFTLEEVSKIIVGEGYDGDLIDLYTDHCLQLDKPLPESDFIRPTFKEWYLTYVK